MYTMLGQWLACIICNFIDDTGQKRQFCFLFWCSGPYRNILWTIFWQKKTAKKKNSSEYVHIRFRTPKQKNKILPFFAARFCRFFGLGGKNKKNNCSQYLPIRSRTPKQKTKLPFLPPDFAAFAVKG